MKKISNILIVSSEFPPQPGGIGNHAFNLGKHLSGTGFNIQVLTDQRDRSNEELEFDEKCDFRVHRIQLKALRVIMYFKRLFRLFKLMKSSELVIATGKFSLWSVAFARIFIRRKTLAVVHGTEVNFKHRLLNYSIAKSLRQFDRIIAVSNFTKSLIDHLNLKSVVVIPNGFQLEKKHRQNNVSTTLSGYPKLITVGNVTERKGQKNVINHLPELITLYPDVHYHCLGFPTEKASLSQHARALGVNDYITFHGRVSHEHLYTYLQEADIFVMLSSPTDTGDVEGFGIAILEANFMGKPAIGSLGCGIEDAIDDGTSGTLVEHDNTSQFVDAVKNTLEHYEKYSKGARLWSHLFSWERIIKLYQEQILSL